MGSGKKLIEKVCECLNNLQTITSYNLFHNRILIANLIKEINKIGVLPE